MWGSGLGLPSPFLLPSSPAAWASPGILLEMQPQSPDLRGPQLGFNKAPRGFLYSCPPK